MPPVPRQRVGAPLMMLPPMGLREQPIHECPTMWFNRDFFESSWPGWTVDVDLTRPTTFVSHTDPGETLRGHPVRIRLEHPGVLWVATTGSPGWAARSPRCSSRPAGPTSGGRRSVNA